jgi:oxygen-independent coproporphyrinogen-3 oxidase
MLELDGDSRLGRETLANGARYSTGSLPSEDETADLYAAACEGLDGAGLRQYEISNFARGGYASRHNIKYWRRQPYLGFGLDAHSMLRTPEAAIRWANPSDLDSYMTMGSPDVFGLRSSANPEAEPIQREQAFEEALFLGLRMNEGVELAALRAEFGEDLMGAATRALSDVEEAGLVELETGRIRLTERGRMASNEVFSRLLLAVAA